ARAAARESRALGVRRADCQPPRRGCGPRADARDDGRARRCLGARDDRVLTLTAVRWLLLAVSVSWVLGWLAAPPLAVFVVSGLAVVPLAGVLGEAAETLARPAGPSWGGVHII